MNHRRGKMVLLFIMLMLSMTGCDSFIKEVTTEQSEEQDSMEYAYPISADIPDASLHVEATYGFNRVAKLGRYMQVYVTIKNEGPSFTGKVNIEIPGLTTMESYQRKVEIAKGSSKECTLSIPITQENMFFSVQILSKDGKILSSNEAKANAPDSINAVNAGILTDVKLMGDYVSKSSLKIIPLSADDISLEAIGLDSIDVLLISNIQINKLNDKQIEAIKEWVKQGGSMVLSNTESDKQIVQKFSEKDFYQIDKVGQEKKTKPYIINNTTNQYQLEDGTSVDVVNAGLGNVQFLPYHISDSDHEYVEARKQIAAEIVKHISNYRKNQINTEYSRTVGYDTRLLDNINADYVTKIPKVTYYVIVLMLYIIIIGPVVYLFLRNKDRRVYIWGIIPVLSVLFIAVVYVLGNTTRIRKPYIRYFTILNVADSGYTEEDTLFTVSSPSEGKLKAKLAGDYDITSLQNQRALSNYKKESSTNLSEIMIGNDQNETALTVEKLNAFVPQYFEANSSYQLSAPDTSLKYVNYKLTGEFTNRFGFDLNNAVMLTSNTVVNIGNIKAGETINTDDKDYQYISSYDVLYTEGMEQYVNRIVGYGEQYDTNLDYLQVTARKNLLQTYMESWLMNNHDASYLIAFDYSDQKSDIVNAFNYSSQGCRMIVLSINENNRIDEKTEFIPDITSYMKVLEGEFYEDLSMIQSEELVVKYSFGKDRIRGLEYSSYYNSEFTKEPWAGFFGEAWFYNKDTKKYDLMFKSGKEWKSDDLSKYLNKDNTLRVKYVIDPDYQNNNVIYVPKLTAIKEVQENVTD